MYKDTKIAVFIDIDNCALTYEQYSTALSHIKEYGKIIYGKAYGVSERKNPEITVDITKQGFDICRPITSKKRNSKVFDYRIAMDVIEYVVTREKILDAVAILFVSNDPMPLFSKISSYGIKILALKPEDKQTANFISSVIEINQPYIPNIDMIIPKPAAKNSSAPADKAKHAEINADTVNSSYETVKDNINKAAAATVSNATEEKTVNKIIEKQPVINATEEKEEQIIQPATQVLKSSNEKPAINRKQSTSDDEELINQIKKLLGDQSE